MEELFDFSFLNEEEHNTVPILNTNLSEIQFNVGENTSNVNIDMIADQYF